MDTETKPKPGSPFCEGCYWPGNCGCFDPPDDEDGESP